MANLMASVESERLKSKTLTFLKQQISNIDKIITDEQNAIGSDKDLISKLTAAREKMSTTVKKAETLYAQIKKKDKSLLYHSADINKYSLQNLIDLAKVAAKGDVKALDDITKNYENLDLAIDAIDGPGFLQQVANGTVFGNVKFSSLLLGVGIASTVLGQFAGASAFPLLGALWSGVSALAVGGAGLAGLPGLIIVGVALAAKLGPKLAGTFNKLFNTKGNIANLGDALNDKGQGESTLSVTAPNRSVTIWGNKYDLSDESERNSLQTSLEINGAINISHDEHRFSFNNVNYNTHLQTDLTKLEIDATPLLKGTKIHIEPRTYDLSVPGDRNDLATDLKNKGVTPEPVHDDFVFSFNGKSFRFFDPKQRDELEQTANSIINAKNVEVNGVTYNLAGSGSYDLKKLLDDLGAVNVWTSATSFHFDNVIYEIKDPAQRADLGVEATKFVKDNEKRIITVKSAGDFDLRKIADVARLKDVLEAAGASVPVANVNTITVNGTSYDLSLKNKRDELQTEAENLVKEMNITVAGKSYNIKNEDSLESLRDALNTASPSSASFTRGLPQFEIGSEMFIVNNPTEATRDEMQAAAEKVIGEKTITVDGKTYNLADSEPGGGMEALRDFLNTFVTDDAKKAKCRDNYFKIDGYPTFNVDEKSERDDLQAAAEAMVRAAVPMKITVDGKPYDLSEGATGKTDLVNDLITLTKIADIAKVDGDKITFKPDKTFNVKISTERKELEAKANEVAKQINAEVIIENNHFNINDDGGRTNLVDYINEAVDSTVAKVVDDKIELNGTKYDLSTSAKRASFASVATALVNSHDKEFETEAGGAKFDPQAAMDTFEKELQAILPEGFTYKIDSTTKIIEVTNPAETDPAKQTVKYDVSKAKGRTALKIACQGWAKEKDKEFELEEGVQVKTDDMTALVATLKTALGDANVELDATNPAIVKIQNPAGTWTPYDTSLHSKRTDLKVAASTLVKEKNAKVVVEENEFNINEPDGRTGLVDYINEAVGSTVAEVDGDGIKLNGTKYETKTSAQRETLGKEATKLVNEHDKEFETEAGGAKFDPQANMADFEKELKAILPEGFTYTVAGTKVEVKNPAETDPAKQIVTYDVSKAKDRTRLKNDSQTWAAEKDAKFITEEGGKEFGATGDITALVDEITAILPENHEIAVDGMKITITDKTGSTPTSTDYNLATHKGRSDLKAFAQEKAPLKDAKIKIGDTEYEIGDELNAGLASHNSKLGVEYDPATKVLKLTLEGEAPVEYNLSQHAQRTLLNGDIAADKYKAKDPVSMEINVGGHEYNLSVEKDCKLLYAALLMYKDDKTTVDYTGSAFNINGVEYVIAEMDSTKLENFQTAANEAVKDKCKESTITVGNKSYNLSQPEDREGFKAALEMAGVKDVTIAADGKSISIQGKEFKVDDLADRTKLQVYANNAVKSAESLFKPTVAQTELADKWTTKRVEAGDNAVTITDCLKALKESEDKARIEGWVFPAGSIFEGLSIKEVEEIKEALMMTKLDGIKSKQKVVGKVELSDEAKEIYETLLNTKSATLGAIIDALLGGTSLKGEQKTLFESINGKLNELETKEPGTKDKLIELLSLLKRTKEQSTTKDNAKKKINAMDENTRALFEEELGGA